MLYIVTCQRGGVSNRPALGSGQRQDTGSGILPIQNFFKNKRTAHLIHFLLRQGEPGTSQYLHDGHHFLINIAKKNLIGGPPVTGTPAVSRTDIIDSSGPPHPR